MLQLVNHLDASYNLAKWLTQNEHDADDIVQDAYLRAIRHFGNFQGGEGRAWLLTIVRNLCYDSMRRRKVFERTPSFDEELHNTGPTNTSDPEACLLQKETGRNVAPSANGVALGSPGSVSPAGTPRIVVPGNREHCPSAHGNGDVTT